MKRIVRPFMLIAGMSFYSLYASGQNARVQVIHNSADALAATVDVYANGAMLFDDFAFRTATPFENIPAGVPITLAIAPGNSTNASQAFATFNVNFVDGETYVVVANGIESPSGYSPSPAFELDVFAGARETSLVSGQTDVLVVHGSTDAPVVDVEVPGAGTVVNDLAYGNFNSYLQLPTVNYTLNITDQTGAVVVRSYQATLQDFSTQNLAITVVAGGFLDPGANSNGAEFGLWVALPSGGNLIPLEKSMARIQVIHNAPDAAVNEVDLYLNGNLLADDFTFRTASAFLDLDAEVSNSIAVAPGNSTNVSQALTTIPLVAEANKTYIAIANGIVFPAGYSPAPAFSLDVFDMGRELAENAGETDVLVFHGSTDAPVVDVEVPGAGTVVNDAAYGDFAGYLELANADYTLNVTDQTGAVVVKSYQAPLQTLGLEDSALVVVASGFLNPAANNNGAAFGLWVALPDGGAMIELPTSNARVQIIHNSADVAVDTVDVYLNGVLVQDDFKFRHATAFLDIDAEVSNNIALAPRTSTNVSQALVDYDVTFNANETYVVVANGIAVASGYTPAPTFGLDVFTGARETGYVGSNTDILVVHGSTDAPVVDVEAGGATIVNDLAYTDFQGYLSVPTSDLVLDITDQTGSTVVASFAAPLQTLNLQGDAITVVASGFLNPANNNNGPAFGLWAATNLGGPLLPLGNVTSVNEEAELISAVYPVPAASEITVQLQPELSNGNISITDLSGRVVYNAAFNSTTIVIPVIEFANGMYVVEISSNSGVQYVSIQIAH